MSPGERESYAGSRACIRCHQDQAEQLESHHGRTLARVDQKAHAALFGRRETVVDSIRGEKYRPGVKDGKPYLEATDGKSSARIEPRYVFGSGNRTFAYMGIQDGALLELRLSYYRQADRWYWTATQIPGAPLGHRLGKLRDAADLEQCFNCHTTALVKQERILPEESIFGVGCEACHGPGRPHIEAVERRDPDRKMPRLGLARDRISLELCGQCHRSPQTGDLDDPMIQRALPRLQGLALSLSDCFRKSGGRLSCITCHDPHRNADTVTRAQYNQQCVACHSPAVPAQLACPTAPRGDCVPCHMPQQAVTIPTEPRFANHWIKVWDKIQPARGNR